MTSWAREELRATDMPDERLEKQLSKILSSLSKNAQESIPGACQGWGETKSVYRFFDNPRIGLAEILSGHKAATIERMLQQPMVLLAQDTTFLNFGTEEAVGMGTLKRTKGEAPIHWMLLTSLPVESYEAAEAVIGWYCCRWKIEIYFSDAKSRVAGHSM